MEKQCWYLSHADVDPGFHSQCTHRQETNVGRCSIQSIEPVTAIPTHPMSKGLGFSQRKILCAALDIHVFRNKTVNWQSFWFPNVRDKSWRPTQEKKKYTKLVWWTLVRTWSSAKNALVAWRVIFLMASFCNHKTRRESSYISCINPQKSQSQTDQTPLEVKPTITKTKADDVFYGIILHLIVYFTKIHRGKAPLTNLVGDTEVIRGCSQLFIRELNRFTFSQHQRHIFCNLVGWNCSCWQSYKGLDGSRIPYQ